MRFVRFQSPERCERGIHVGIFGLVNMLGRRGVLSAEEDTFRAERNRWFDGAYTTPRGVYEGHDLAVAWFKRDAAAHLVDATAGYLELLDRHSVAWERVESDDPGRVVYEDEHQVVVVPHPDS